MKTLTEINNIQSRVLKTELVNWRELQFIQNDKFKELLPEAKHKLKASIVANNFTQPFYIWEDFEGVMWCLDGKHRTILLEELLSEGINVPYQLPATFIHCDNKKEASKLVLIYSSMYAKITEEGFNSFIQMNELNLDELLLEIDIPALETSPMNLNLENIKELAYQSLQERFIVPPFSILDTRQGYWQQRKKNWTSLGIDSQATREDIDIVSRSGQGTNIYELRNKMREQMGRDPDWNEIIEKAKELKMHVYEGASVFDPVLTEIAYTWFCPANAKILDPFAGGSVRGIVAAYLGHNYTGIDLRQDQVEANIKNANEVFFNKEISGTTEWITADSCSMDKVLPEDFVCDFIFSCPPYHDLEKYSEDKDDLSNMNYDKFIEAYRIIIFRSLMRLKPDRFACFVVSDIRNKQGFYRDFVSNTIEAFTKQHLCDGVAVHLYNEIILVNVAGSLPIRINKQFSGYRKVGKMHQNVLVFYKGDPKMIKQNFPEIEAKLMEAIAE